MKRILTIALMLVCTSLIGAQNISVSSFKLLENDLDANTAGTMEKDQNGEVAALIKVVTTQTGFTFGGELTNTFVNSVFAQLSIVELCFSSLSFLKTFFCSFKPKSSLGNGNPL